MRQNMEKKSKKTKHGVKKKGGKTSNESIVTIWDKKHYRDSFFVKRR